jgi:hypothetical protein
VVIDMLRTSMLLAAILVLLNGCATYRNDSHERMQTLPHHYAQFDAKLAWEVKPVDGATVVNGVVRNIRYHEMTDLEIWVYVLDADGKEVQRAVDFVYMLKENESAPFALKIKPAASGTKLRFMYRYIGHEGGGESGDSIPWQQAFDAVVP